MPRAHWGRFEPLDHFVLGHLSILAPLSALGSPHAVKRFIGLVLALGGKIAAHASHIARMNMVRRSHEHRSTGCLSRSWPPARHLAAIGRELAVCGLNS